MEQVAERYNNNLLQYINPSAHGKARQAFQAHGGLPSQELYKTVMCQTWLETASCGFGANCKFAHGEEELRPCMFPPPSVNLRKFKTRLCEKYTKRGICPYGSRCFFIHPEPSSLGTNNTQSSEYRSQPAPLSLDDASSMNQAMESRGESVRYNVPSPLFIPPLQPISSYYYPPATTLRLDVCSEHLFSNSDVSLEHLQGGELSRMESCPDLPLRSIWSPSEEEDIFGGGCNSVAAETKSLSGGVVATVSSGINVTAISTTNNTMVPWHQLEAVEQKRCESAFNDSFGCFKEFHETLTSSLANLLDVSDTRL